MDEARAKRMTSELLGRSVGGWNLAAFAGAGKSALVFKAYRAEEVAAIKIFDPELIERFGKKTQIERIARELRLKHLNHPHLIRILDGGECVDTGHLFVAMEFLDAPNLHSLLQSVPRNRIWPIIAQVASAAHFLEGQHLAHRDIKPENIAIDRGFENATLLDLGVLRPFGDSSLTDVESKPFIGTLRYSPPELLLRKDDGSLEDWRAITFYQLGAVLHDLIMRKQIFSEHSEPFMALGNAVQTVHPQIEASDVPADLIVLANNCLVKLPDVRNSIVTWERFESPTHDPSRVASAKARVRNRQLQNAEHQNNPEIRPEPTSRPQMRLLAEVSEAVESLIRAECRESFPRFTVTRPTGSTADKIHVRVLFENSQAHSLYGFLSILFTIIVVDVLSRVVKVTSVASLSQAQTSDFDLVNADTVDLFVGAYIKELLSERVADTLFVILDEAQALGNPVFERSGTIWLGRGSTGETIRAIASYSALKPVIIRSRTSVERDARYLFPRTLSLTEVSRDKMDTANRRNMADV